MLFAKSIFEDKLNINSRHKKTTDKRAKQSIISGLGFCTYSLKGFNTY